jgi:hypothetical protein
MIPSQLLNLRKGVAAYNIARVFLGIPWDDHDIALTDPQLSDEIERTVNQNNN